ncbi:MAG: hypothetical protein ACE37F_08425 [Nannocystaceae bacterium]|nr:hypothetical protein [bacterium]
MLRLKTAALAVLLCAACDGGKAQPDAAAAKSASAEAQKPAEAKAAEPADAESAEPAASEPSAAEADPLGQRFRDPAWFRGTMLGDKGTKVDFARSEANEAGLFKSHLIFEMAEGTTVDDCVSAVTDALKDAVELSREDQPNDRAQLTGSTDRYEVTAVCGEGKGKMRAYVAYEWTR